MAAGGRWPGLCLGISSPALKLGPALHHFPQEIGLLRGVLCEDLTLLDLHFIQLLLELSMWKLGLKEL